MLYCNDINLCGSVVFGYVGVVGFGFEMLYVFKVFNYGKGFGIVFVIFIFCIVMEIVFSMVCGVMFGE